MSDNLDENIASLFQRMLPLLSSMFFLFLSYLPLDLSYLNNIRPVALLICVYYWLLHRPDLFNLLSVYFLGLLADIVSSAPFGSNVFALLLLYVLVINTSRFFNAKPFVVTWYGFALLSFVTMISRWLIVSIYYSQFLPLTMVLFSVLATIAAYPLVSLALAYVQNSLMQGEE